VAGNIEWLNQNASRNYPFREDASLTDSTGISRLPNNVVVDFVFTAPAGLDLEIYLKTFLFGDGLISMVFADSSGSTVTSLTVDTTTHVENSGYKLVGQGEYEDAVGRIAIGDLTELSLEVPQGSYSFTQDNASLEVATIRPDIRGVRALKLLYADGSESQPIYGNVKLVAGLNVRLTRVDVGTEQGIRIDALSNDLEEECDCDTELLNPTPIRTINGVEPDGNGNIEILTPGSTTDISGSTGRLTLSDTSTEPCCGCTELEQLTESAQDMQTTLQRLAEIAEALGAKQTDFSNNVLRSIV
jgi:hypothetical protein